MIVVILAISRPHVLVHHAQLFERPHISADAALRALHDISLVLQEVRSQPHPRSEAELAKFYEHRLGAMESFFHTLDSIVAMLLQVERLRVDGLRALLGAPKKPKPGR